MAADNEHSDDEIIFEGAIKSLEAQVANVGAHLTIDSNARLTYTRQIRRMADELRTEVRAGKLTWAQAAQQAQEARNAIMDIVRSRSTPVGRSIAQRLKKDGYSLNQLIARKTIELFGKTASFPRLSAGQQNTVFAAIVSAAGKSNPSVTRAMARLSYAGRGLIFLSLGLSVYNVASSTDKGLAIKKEATITGASVAGGIAGGALAGLACGPGAPVCVTVGAFVGGALAAFGAGFMW